MKSISVINVIILLFIFIVNGCKKPDDTEPAVETGTVTDVEGNIYKTVKIGGQWWMAENLKTTKYRNGHYIPVATNQTDWKSTTIGAYCYYENNSDNIESYGLLYNWFAISDSNNLAPEGWHIPTDDDWKKMEMHLGMNQPEADKAGWRGSNEGDQLKVEGHLGWSEYGTVWPTNTSGFTAYGSCCRLPNAEYGQPGLKSTGFWWTSSESTGNEAFYRYLDYKNSNIFRSHDSKYYGFSVRCVKD